MQALGGKRSWNREGEAERKQVREVMAAEDGQASLTDETSVGLGV